MKTKTIYLLTGSLLLTGVAGWLYYDHYIKVQPREHGVGVMKLSCSEAEMKSLELQVDGSTLWIKKHDELLNMQGAIESQDRRFKGHKVLPLFALTKKYENLKQVVITPCDADNITLSIKELNQQKDAYILGQNRQGRMKLLQYDGRPNTRYKTILRNVKALNLNH